MRKPVKWILFSALALLVLWVIVRAASGKEGKAVKVIAESVKQRTIVETVSASGKVQPATEVKVGSPINGEVTELLVSEGDTVRKGQVLARIRGDRTASSPQRITVPNVPPGFESLVQGMQTQPRAAAQSSATITAPIDGTVLGLNIRAGERTGAMQLPGSELFRIADMNNIDVRVDVNENNIIKVSIGDSADVEVDAYNRRTFKGIVIAIGSGAGKRDAQSFVSADVASYEVRIRLLPSSYADLYADKSRRSLPFRPNMNARAEIKTERKEGVLAVPVGAVASRSKSEKAEGAEKDPSAGEEPTETATELEEVVFVLRTDGTVEKRPVTVGIQDFNFFEVKSGLKEGEKVITGPNVAVATDLRGGQKVLVVKREQLFEKK